MATAQIITSNPLVRVRFFSAQSGGVANIDRNVTLDEARSLRDALEAALTEYDDRVWRGTGTERDPERQPVPSALPDWVQDLIVTSMAWRGTVNPNASALGSAHDKNMNRLIRAADAIPGVDACL